MDPRNPPSQPDEGEGAGVSFASASGVPRNPAARSGSSPSLLSLGGIASREHPIALLMDVIFI